MEVSVSGCLERVLVAIKSSSCDKENHVLSLLFWYSLHAGKHHESEVHTASVLSDNNASTRKMFPCMQ